MTVGNLGVCFGPTLLRPKEETMAAIMDIKFCNVVVEVLIANYEQVIYQFGGVVTISNSDFQHAATGLSDPTVSTEAGPQQSSSSQ